MSTEIITSMLIYYDSEICRMICDKYGIDHMSALRRFLCSKTYKMLIDPDLEMWDFSPIAIFDMWENEQITGDPRNSLYIRRD